MGLIKAGIGAIGGVLADQWKEFFSCDSLDSETLVVRAERVSVPVHQIQRVTIM